MRNRSTFSRAAVIAATLFSLIVTVPASAAELPELLQQAQSLLQGNKPQQALDVLAAEELQYAGDQEFDYWLGLTAVRAGRPAQGIFALERVLAADPNHAGARLELASAYVQLGQADAARRELDRLEQLAPPPAAAERIAQLNKAVARQEQASQNRNRVIYLTLEAGHDDNVGTWPDARFDVLPGAPQISPVDAAFYSLQGGIWQRFNLNGANTLDLSLNGLMRDNQQDDAEQFDQDYLSGRAEWARDLDGQHQLAFGADVAGMNLDGEEYYRFVSLHGEWRNRLSSTRSYRTRLAYRDVNFDLDLYDYTLTRLLAGMTWIVGGNLRVTVEANIDSESADDRPGGDALVYGLRASLLRPVTATQRIGLNASWQRAGYDEAYAPFTALNLVEEDRDDNRLSLAGNWDWLPTPEVQVRLRAEYREQDSTLDTYEFDQTLGSLALSYYF